MVRVLVCDDQVISRQLFEMIVNSSENYKLVKSLESAKVADIYCSGGNVDLILMDIVMNDINGLDAAEATGAQVFHAGTALDDAGALVAAGGRVLSIVGTGIDLTAARVAAYDRLAGIKLPGSHYRSDIGLAAVEGRIAL